MRTMTTSIAQTCPACGALNRVVIMTAGMAPGWRIGCSRCGATVVEARSARTAPPAEPARSAEIVHLPVPVRAGAGRGTAPAIRHQRLPQRRWSARARAGASSGVSLLAACGMVMAFLLFEHDSEPPDADGAVIGLARVDLPEKAPAPAHARPVEPGALAAVVPDETGLPDRAIRPGAPVLRAGAAPGRVAGDHGHVIPRYRLAAELALGGRQAAYPDPREGMADLQLAALADPEAAAEAEVGLELTRATRREIQRRLRLAAYDPQGVDGIFGPATRTAIAAWQEGSGLAATGYITPHALARLIAETDEAYGSWQLAQKARRASEQQLAAAAPVPRPQQVGTDGCARSRSGRIAYGQNFRCDVRGLSERLGAVGATLAQSLDGTDQPSPWSMTPRRPDDA